MAISTAQKRTSKKNRILAQEVSSISSSNNKKKSNNEQPVEESEASSMTAAATTNSSSVVYDASFSQNGSGGGGGALRRFRTPAPHDVLSGRGGNVNAHPGNSQFRDLVKVRKEDYSLAHSKDEKALICRQVIALVVDELGGRFLVKENPNSQWWVELDDERIMAKTSQALREGAPQIRATHNTHHREEGSSSIHTTNHTILPEPVGSSSNNTTKEQRAAAAATARRRKSLPKQETDRVTNKRLRLQGDNEGHDDHNDELFAPAIVPSGEASSTTLPSTAPYSKDDYSLMPAPDTIAPSIPLPRRVSSSAWFNNISVRRPGQLKRANSLALSEFGEEFGNGEEALDFVNPFADESELLGRNNNTNGSVTTAARVPSEAVEVGPLLPPRLYSSWRDTSTSSDMAGLGALFRSNESVKSIGSLGTLPSYGSLFREKSSNNPSSVSSNTTTTELLAHKMSHRSSYSNLSSRFADENNEDSFSVASEHTVGLPLWEWFNRDELLSSSNVPISQ